MTLSLCSKSSKTYQRRQDVLKQQNGDTIDSYLRLTFGDSVFQKAFTYISRIRKVFVLLISFNQHVQVADVIRCQTKSRLETAQHTIAEASAGISTVPER